MNVIFYTNIVSPHQMPWCREMVKLVGEEHFLYVAEEGLHRERAAMGWHDEAAPWIHVFGDADKDRAVLKQLETCDVLISSLRRFDLFRRRVENGLRTYYMFERWFKPPVGAWRMLHPGYFNMCRQACALAREPHFRLLPIGIPAVADWMRMENFCRGNLFQREKAWSGRHSVMEPVPGRENMFLWGYFVQETAEPVLTREAGMLHVLWCGRMLDWKRVDTIVRAALLVLKKGIPLHLHLIGDGPEKERLKKLADPQRMEDRNKPGISFADSMPMEVVRQAMRQHDVYVLSSDGGEGWGAAANEALNEGMILIGTQEAGSTATMIEHGGNGFLYPAKDAVRLAELLMRGAEMKQKGSDTPLRLAARTSITTDWSPAYAACKLRESFGK